MLLLLLFIMHRIAGAASRAHIYLSSASIERNSMGKKRFDLILDARDISFFFPSTKPQILSSCNIRFRYSFCSNFYFRIFFIYYIQLFDSKPYFFDCIVSIHWYGWHCDLSTDLLQLRWRIGFFFRYVDGKWKSHRILNIYFLSGIIFLCLRCSHRACTAMKCVNCLAINENASNIYSNNVSINSHGTTI